MLTEKQFIRIINKQFIISKHKIRFKNLTDEQKDWRSDIPWFHEYTATESEQDEFRVYLKWRIWKMFPYYSVNHINSVVSWFILEYWLKIDDLVITD